jgi:hypothetical protein
MSNNSLTDVGILFTVYMESRLAKVIVDLLVFISFVSRLSLVPTTSCDNSINPLR